MKHIKLFEEFINEEIHGTDKVISISDVNKLAAKSSIGAGTKDGDQKDDVATGRKVSIAVNKLSAAQTEIIPEKAICMALVTMLNSKPTKIGGDLGSIISKDDYIMDGHHRWAATYLCDPSAKVEAVQIDLPGTALVSALNIITVGLFSRGGNQGSGEIKDFTADKIGKLLDVYIEGGINGVYPLTSEEVKFNLGLVPGANGDYERGKSIMMSNANKLPKKIMPGAPQRVEMPVIGPDEVEKVKTMLAQGVVDIKPPYSDEVKKDLNK